MLKSNQSQFSSQPAPINYQTSSKLKSEECCEECINFKECGNNDLCKISTCVIITIIVCFLIALIVESVSQISSTEVGIEYKTVVAELNPEIMTEGLRSHTPFSEIIRWPITYQTVETSLVCNSKDGIQILLDISFQYIPLKSSIYELTKQYGNFDNYQKIVVSNTESSIRHTCSDFTSVEYQQSRESVHTSLQVNIIGTLSKIKANVIELQLRNVDRPDRYENSIAQTEDARSDINLAKNERLQNLTQVNTLLIEAKQNANKTLDLASAQARIILTKAELEANIITLWYNTRKNIYTNIKILHNFSIPNLLSYLQNQVFSSTGNMVVSEPSKLKY